MDHSYRSYVNIMERKAIAEIRQRGLKKKYELVRKRLETEMQLEELEITMEFEEIEVLQKATRNEENLFAKNDVCNLCRATHKTVECPVLKTKSPEERFSLVWKLRLCLNCFDKNHIAQECDSGDRCEVAGCRKRHSTLLHQDELSKVSPRTQLAKQATREAVNQQPVVRDKHSGLGYNSNAPLQQAPDHSQLKDEVPKCPEAPTSHIQNSQLKASKLRYSPNSLVRPQQQQNRLQSHSVQKDEPAKPPQAPVQQQPDANNKNIARAPQIHAKLRHQLSEGAPSRAETHTQTTRYCRPEEVSSQFVSRTDRRTEQTAQCRQPEGVNSQPATRTYRNETHGNNEDVKKKEIHENEMVAPGDQSVIQRLSDSETSKEENQIHDQDNVRTRRVSQTLRIVHDPSQSCSQESSSGGTEPSSSTEGCEGIRDGSRPTGNRSIKSRDRREFPQSRGGSLRKSIAQHSHPSLPVEGRIKHRSPSREKIEYRVPED